MTFEEYLSSLKGKTVGVIGVGVSNRPLIEKLLERGIDVTAPVSYTHLRAGIKKRIWENWGRL